MEVSDIGLIGLAVMGENLALNLESKGYTVSVYKPGSSGPGKCGNSFCGRAGKRKAFPRDLHDRGVRGVHTPASEDHVNGESRRPGG